MRFHGKCGERITLLNDNMTAVRNVVEFNQGVILSAEPLVDDVMFEIRIEKRVNVWNGGIEIGVTTLDPNYIDLPPTATKLKNTTWIMSSQSILKDGAVMVNSYCPELDTLREGDCLGVMRSSKDELMFFINARCLGIAVKRIPARVFAVIDLFGQCVQVTILNNPPAMVPLPPPPRPILDISPDQLQEVTVSPSTEEAIAAIEFENGAYHLNAFFALQGENDELAACTSVPTDMLRFHTRCGILVKLSANNKTAERVRPLDDYNNAVIMTHRPLNDNELFEIRIDRLIDKWSGSIEVGVTTHDPATMRFPSTMTNMDTGTIMMSGSKILVNGQGTCLEYGTYNLDELKEGDTIGMIRMSNGKLHYYINGLDQGVASDQVTTGVWGVIDLYGMTVKVTILDPCDAIDSNIRDTLRDAPPVRTPPTRFAVRFDEDSLLFHSLRDSNVVIFDNGRTAHRPDALEAFDNGVVMTNRTLRTNELFQVRIDSVVPKWAGSIEIGVTQLTCNEIEMPFKLSKAKNGIWVLTGEDVIRDGTVIIPQYIRNLNRLIEGDSIGVMRKDLGILHFYINGVDQGPAAFNIPEFVYGIIDLYGRVAQATIVDNYVPSVDCSPESPSFSGESSLTTLPDMCFHQVHGRNARLNRNRLMAARATVYSEFNHAVLFSSRPLRECEMFELRIDKMVDCWIGSLEIGVTAINPDDLEVNGVVEVAGTATDLTWDTYILSGSAMMKDGECVKTGYPLDLDTLTTGSKVGIMLHTDKSVHYYLDGMDQGKAWNIQHLDIYAVVDLYGQCTQITLVDSDERCFNYNGRRSSDNPRSGNMRTITLSPQPYSFSEYCGENVLLSPDFTIARRVTATSSGALVFSAAHLVQDEMFEIKVLDCKGIGAGSLRVGVTDINILNVYVNHYLPSHVSLLPHFTAHIEGRYLIYSNPGTNADCEIRSIVPSFDWLRPDDRIGLKKVTGSRVLIYYNSELLDVAIENVPDRVYAVIDLQGRHISVQAVSKLSSGVSHHQPAFVEEIKDGAGASGVEENACALPNDGVTKQERPQPFSFYPHHGPNIKLCNFYTVAIRHKGYKDAVVVVKEPLQCGQKLNFRVDIVNDSWDGSLAVGAIGNIKEGFVVPDSAAEFEEPCWILSNNIKKINNQMYYSNDGLCLLKVTEQSIVSIYFKPNKDLVIMLEDKVIATIDTLPTDVDKVYPIMDLYGKVQQISLLLNPYAHKPITPFESLMFNDYLPPNMQSSRFRTISEGKINVAPLLDEDRNDEVPRSLSCMSFHNNDSDINDGASISSGSTISTSMSFSGFPFQKDPIWYGQNATLETNKKYYASEEEELTLDQVYYFKHIMRNEANVDKTANKLSVNWQLCSSQCEYAQTAYRYWVYISNCYSDMKMKMRDWKVSCFCPNCDNNPPPSMAGWVRIDKPGTTAFAARGEVVYWHVDLPLPVVPEVNETIRRPKDMVELPQRYPCESSAWYDSDEVLYHASVAIELSLGTNDIVKGILMFIDPMYKF